jgi:hypothetical protein
MAGVVAPDVMPDPLSKVELTYGAGGPFPIIAQRLHAKVLNEKAAELRERDSAAGDVRRLQLRAQDA